VFVGWLVCSGLQVNDYAADALNAFPGYIFMGA
jgi:hypothetical protein